MKYHIEDILNLFRTYDDVYAWQFLQDPLKFMKLLETTDELRDLYRVVMRIYGNDAIAVLGGIALMSSQAIHPDFAKMAEIRKRKYMKMNVTSANGAFSVYNTCCPAPNNQMFLKVALSSSADNFETEAVALNVIKHYVPSDLKKYFLDYKASGKCAGTKAGNAPALLIHEHVKIFHYKTNRKNIMYPFIITNAVPSGLSLDDICSTWASVGNKSKRLYNKSVIEAMRMFHKNDAFDRYIMSKTPIGGNSLVNAGKHIMAKLEDFFKGVLRACSLFHMSHGDLHSGNVLYDAVQDCFVMIDYGRAACDLSQLSSTLVVNECLKFGDMPYTKHEIAKDPMKLYHHFKNYNSRLFFDKNSLLSKYALLWDLVGLVYNVYSDLQVALKVRANFVKRGKGSSGTLMIWAMPLNDISAVFFAHSSKLTIFDLLMCMLAVIIHKMHDKQLIAFSKMPNTVEEVDVFNNDGVFYHYGQPTASYVKDLQADVENSLNSFGFFDILEKLLQKHQQFPSALATGGKTKREFTRIEQKRLDNITQRNYQHNNKIRTKSIGNSKQAKAFTKPRSYSVHMMNEKRINHLTKRNYDRTSAKGKMSVMSRKMGFSIPIKPAREARQTASSD